MDQFWQNVLIWSAIVLAGGYLIIHYVRQRKKKTHCEECQRRIASQVPRKDAP